MTKKTIRKKKTVKPLVPVAMSYSISESAYEINTVKLQIRNMNDRELYEYCWDHIQMYDNEELDQLFPKVAEGSDLTKDERNKLEAFCILANTELCLNV